MTLSRRSKRTILALFVLVVPSICYMLLRTGTNYYHSLPVYGPDGASLFSEDFSDSAWHQIDFSRLSGEGLPEIGLHAPTGNRNKIYVAGFFRENVNASAETLAVNMIRVAKTYKDMERLEFITFIATDSASSSVTSLEKLLEHYGANPEKWKPVRLPVAEAAEVARRMFFLHPGTAADDPGQPLNDTIVLIDSHQRIRGYYDGSSYFATDTLEDEITVLWKEELNRDDQE